MLNTALSYRARSIAPQKQNLALVHGSHSKPKDMKHSVREGKSRLSHMSNGQRSFFNPNEDSAFQDTCGPLIPERVASPMEGLHNAVYFDEADFDNDNDLEFEGAGFNTKPHDKLRPPEKSQQYQETRLVDPPCILESSWASSPSEHKTETMRNKEQYILPISKKLPIVKLTSDLNEESKCAIPVKETKTRRTLPWVFHDNRPSNSATKNCNQENGLSPPSVRQISLEGLNASRNLRRQTDLPRKRQISTSHGDRNLIKKNPTKRPRNAGIKLCNEQEAISSLVCQDGESVFFTGSAGTGKSVLLREIIKRLRRKHQKDPEQIAITASTGLAACNIGGVTLHSFAGIGLGKGSVTELVNNIRKNKKSISKWLRTKVLIMDEISMVDGLLFDKLEEIARILRRTTKPFGGIQLVVTGDFFQLPPVPDSNEANKMSSMFAFEAKTWAISVKNTIALTQVFRQQDEGNLS